MRRTIALVLAGAVLALPAAATATIRPQKGMSGVSLGMTKAQVQGRAGTTHRHRRRALLLRSGLGGVPARPGRRDHDDALVGANRLGSRRRLHRGSGSPLLSERRLRAFRRLPTVPSRKREARNARDRLPARARACAPGHDPAPAKLAPTASTLPWRGGCLKRRTVIQLVLPALAAFFVMAIPAAGSSGDPEPLFVGGNRDDAFGGLLWFRLRGRARRASHHGGHLRSPDRRRVADAQLPDPRSHLSALARLLHRAELRRQGLLAGHLRGHRSSERRTTTSAPTSTPRRRCISSLPRIRGYHLRRHPRRLRQPGRPAASSTAASRTTSTAATPRLHLHLGAGPADRHVLRRRQAHDADSARHLHDPGARSLHDS